MEVEEGGQRSTRSIAFIVPLELDCEEADAVSQTDERDDSCEGTAEEAVPSDYSEEVPSDFPAEASFELRKRVSWATANKRSPESFRQQ